MLTSIDYSRASHCRLYREEPPALRDLPMMAKAIRDHVRTLVEPTHGWLALRGSGIDAAVGRHATGQLSRAEKRLLESSIAELVTRKYVLRCRVFDVGLGTFTTADKRAIELSPWLEDEAGDCMVIRDWVASERALTPAETSAWHAARRSGLQESTLSLSA